MSAVLTDTSITHVARAQIVDDLLRGKVSTPALRIAVYAAGAVPAQEVPSAVSELAYAARTLRENGEFHHPGLALLDARRRVAGFADEVLDQVDTENFSTIEDDLFRWARTVEGNEALRRVLLDREAPAGQSPRTARPAARGQGPSRVARARAVLIVGGRPRDVVGTLDYLVNYVAQSRDWRMARVRTARELNPDTEDELVESLHALTGKNVELQVADDRSLLGGVLVEIGDLRLDASTRGPPRGPARRGGRQPRPRISSAIK